MRLFHFMEKRWGIENVKKSRIKVATLNNMNDPYEFYLRFEGATAREIQKFKDHYNSKAGFICLSRRLGDPVQWAHYADNHRGMCFEFQVPDNYPLKIKYLKSPKLIKKNSSWRDELVNGTLCKYRGWAYEREYRISIDLESSGSIQEDGLYFAQFTNTFVPSKVYIGLRCELTEEEEDLLASNQLPVHQMYQNSDTYLLSHHDKRKL